MGGEIRKWQRRRGRGPPPGAPLTSIGGSLKCGSALSGWSASSVFAPSGTFNNFTLASIGPPIDHIFVDSRLNVGRFAVPTDVTDAGVISDHFPVLAEITPPAPQKRARPKR